MKNIWLLPTDKPSRLVLNSINNDLFLTTTKNFPSDIMKFKNIYIISDEEIKEGDWYWLEKIDKIGTKSGAYKSGNAKVSRLNTLASNCKKIILTTDKDLINDGVQAIDDEFLEWFVKNPSCEWVEISLEETQYGSGIYEYVIYKREIPKEEPKQETLEKYSERFNNKENEIVDGIFNPENWGNRIVKQETLEEVAKKKYPMFKGETYIGNNKKMLKRAAFIAGAKWQQEQIYNLIKELYDNENITGFSKKAYAQCLDIVEQFKNK